MHGFDDERLKPLLISLGWTMTRDHLTPRERYVLGGVFSVYVAILGLKVDCERRGEDQCQATVLSEYVIRSLILLAIIGRAQRAKK